MGECEKRNCSYYWQDEDEDYPRCHYDDPMFPAPCEEDDDYYEPDDIDDDSHYDPYTGSDDIYDYMNDIDLDDWSEY